MTRVERVLGPFGKRLQVRVWFKFRTRAKGRKPREVSRVGEEKARTWRSRMAQDASESHRWQWSSSQNEPVRTLPALVR